jgi:methionine-rich copper-binding protein CopC
MVYWQPFSSAKDSPMPASRLKLLFASTSLLLGCLLSPLAFAHAHLKTQTPAANATVAAPAELRLSFSEGIEPSFSQVTVTGADGKSIAVNALNTAAGDNKTLIVTPAAPLAAGQYKVQWQVLSVDTHKSDGDYSFTVGQ